MPGWKEISDFVLKHDYCCGCGVCAGLCPQNVLEMRFNKYGEYKPYLVGQCTDCGLCSKVCPFVRGNPNEDEIGKEKFGGVPGVKHTPETGYYLDSYVGYASDPDIRWNAASGGLTTALLCELLARNAVDYVITVAPTNDSNRLFEYRVLSDLQSVRACSKSAYYPVELSSVLRFVGSHRARFALVGLPCFLKGVELASRYVPPIRERIHFKIGLTCGQLYSAFMAQYLVRLKRVNCRKVARVSFREKKEGKPFRVYLFKAFGEEGSTLCEVPAHEGYGKVFMREYFQLNACGYCDDVFAECADITFMDAWLDAYRDTPEEGTSLSITRSAALRGFWEDLGQFTLKCIPIDKVIKSQAGTLRKKRNELAIRLYLKRKRGGALLTKRVRVTSRCSTLTRAGIYVSTKERWRRAAKKAMLVQRLAAPTGLSLFMLLFYTMGLPAFVLSGVSKYGGRIIAKLRIFA